MTRDIGLYEDEWSAEIYDYENRSTGDLPFWQALAEETGGPTLELGCGTGRLLLPLARAGVRVTGLDLSPHMLGVAKRKLAQERAEVQERVQLLQGDFGDFSLGETYDLIYIPSRNLQVFLERDEQRRCLECCARHLRPGGRFAINVFNPRLDWINQPEGFGDEPHEFAGPDGTVVTQAAHTVADRANQTVISRWRYESRRTDGEVTGHEYLLRLHYFFRFEVEWMLDACGFEVEMLYGDVDRGAFTSGSSDTLFVATRTG